MKVKTSIIKSLLSKSAKCSSNNKMIPLTSLICVESHNGELTMTTTDGVTYLKVSSKIEDTSDFYVVVDVDILNKLVSRTTSSNMTMFVDNTVLSVKGNGEYKIELTVDESGNMIKYPNPADKFVEKFSEDIEHTDITDIVKSCKSALATNVDSFCYTGYYIGENIVATDTYKICSIDRTLVDKPVIVYPEFLDLVDLVMGNTAVFKYNDSEVLIEFNNSDIFGYVYSRAVDGIENFQLDAINSFIKQDFECSCSVDKSELLKALDRMSLFVTRYDKNIINLTFCEECVTISSVKYTGIETVTYVGSHNQSDYSCSVDIEILISQVKSQPTDVIEIEYGESNSIKLHSDDLTTIIALSEV